MRPYRAGRSGPLARRYRGSPFGRQRQPGAACWARSSSSTSGTTRPAKSATGSAGPTSLSAVAGLGGGLLLAARILPARAASTFAWLAIVGHHGGRRAGRLSCRHRMALVGRPRRLHRHRLLTPGSGADFTPFRFVRCDEAAWRFLGISLAGYNAIISFGVAAGWQCCCAAGAVKRMSTSAVTDRAQDAAKAAGHVADATTPTR